MPSYRLATIYEDHHVRQEFAVDNLPLHLTRIDSFGAEHGTNAMGVYVDNVDDYECEQVHDLKKEGILTATKRMAKIITLKGIF